MIKAIFIAGIFAVIILVVFGLKFLIGIDPISLGVSKVLARDTYIACGCGCCGQPSALAISCIYSKSRYDQIIAADKKWSSSPSCALMGCSGGQAYAYCGLR